MESLFAFAMSIWSRFLKLSLLQDNIDMHMFIFISFCNTLEYFRSFMYVWSYVGTYPWIWHVFCCGLSGISAAQPLLNMTSN